uniref:2-oxoadipate dioxygenase/decarboxylase n=1 Tax=Cacopsylla melanoneura TaxID=428564 RepID=A0A8D8SKU6_9HEMI
MKPGKVILKMHHQSILRQILFQSFAPRRCMSTNHHQHPMPHDDIVNSNQIRHLFSKSMSDMYKKEVPQYSQLLELVRQVNMETLEEKKKLKDMSEDDLERLHEERHGAIRLGTAEELYNMRRLFSVMNMHPVGYYDLSPAGVPVHSTAFRSTDDYSLNQSPFRVFTSLLRLELIENKDLRDKSSAILNRRRIFSEALMGLIEKFETDGALRLKDAASFIAEAIKVFKFNNEITVSYDTYSNFHKTHPLVADIVCFKSPHINHLTPSTLDIDRVQDKMVAEVSKPGACIPKAVIEGPPKREVPILLRQTSFKALTEDILAPGEDGDSSQEGKHTARFGEVEQRGIALTPKGRQLYDYLLDKTRGSFQGIPNESNSKLYMENLESNFSVFPDDLNTLRKDKLAYFKYHVTESGKDHLAKNVNDFNWDNYLKLGFISYSGITYEDFLPVSAAGIFQSNLSTNQNTRRDSIELNSSRADFEDALGCSVQDELKLYAELEKKSIQDCTFYFIR